MSSDKVLFSLKARGPATARSVAVRLEITTEGVRQHLHRLEREGLVCHQDRRETVGRPKRYWELTSAGHARFPDTHSYLTVELLDAIAEEFGEGAVERLVSRREAKSLRHYRAALKGATSLRERLERLAAIRSDEGYMAKVERLDDGAYLFIEQHCPICAAARRCRGFCRSELDTFRRLVGARVKVERAEHIVAGARRCAYRVEPRARGARP